MTGFAATAAELPGLSLAVELRSVNHRYLDLSVKLPDELRAQEPALRERLASELKRGKVECRIALGRAGADAANLEIDATRLERVAEVAAKVMRAVPGAVPLTTAELLRWPGVLVESAVAPERLIAEVVLLVDRALAELRGARAREGSKLADILLARCGDLDQEVARVLPRIPSVHAAYVEKLGARLKEAELDPNEERLKQELALFATKIDVAEEVARLSAHIAEFRRVLREGGAVGKRLDFLAQELNREANTLGSKSVDAELSRASLEMKVLIEQMREQVQNLE